VSVELESTNRAESSGISNSIGDAGDRKQMGEEIGGREKELRQLTDSLPQQIIAYGPKGNVLYANRVLLEYHGYTMEDIQAGNYPEKVIHPEDLEKVMRERLHAFSRGDPFELELRILGRNGEYRWFLIRLNPLLDEGREIIRWYESRTDIEDRKRANEALRRSEAYLAEAQRLSHTGSWAWNVHSRENVHWSAEHYRTFGFDPEEGLISFQRARDRIHPDDVAKFDEVLENAFLEKVDYELDFRLVFPDGSIKYVHTVGHPIVDASGDVVEVIGTNMDVTKQHEAKVELEKAFSEIEKLKDQLLKENLVLKEEIDRSSMFEEIVGSSPALEAVLSLVSKVAPTDSTVLITGETGTGKELIARAIHKRSRRSSRAFVNVNCAAIPPSLIGSELFGHEKGAFTGAIQRRLGRFELAEGGTIFLDEVGELPAETQSSLLRVLQEREFERVGGSQPIQTDVRVIAATNRNLNADIAAGVFREDLFYRLNVFPIEIPPLRERKEDIPMLVAYFIDRYASKAGKKIRSINKQSLGLLQSYPWPGNIRELQNVIERSVIVCETDSFSVDESWLSRDPVQPQPANHVLPHEIATHEKEMIEAALAATGGRVSGPTGAAARLGIPPSTLESKIRSLKINKHRFKSSG